jgi:hypothetical protein
MVLLVLLVLLRRYHPHFIHFLHTVLTSFGFFCCASLSPRSQSDSCDSTDAAPKRRGSLMRSFSKKAALATEEQGGAEIGTEQPIIRTAMQLVWGSAATSSAMWNLLYEMYLPAALNFRVRGVAASAEHIQGFGSPENRIQPSVKIGAGTGPLGRFGEGLPELGGRAMNMKLSLSGFLDRRVFNRRRRNSLGGDTGLETLAVCDCTVASTSRVSGRPSLGGGTGLETRGENEQEANGASQGDQGRVKGVVYCRDLSTGESWEKAVLELDLTDATATVTQCKELKTETQGGDAESAEAAKTEAPAKHKRRRSLTNMIMGKKAQSTAADDSTSAALDVATADLDTVSGVSEQAAVKGVLIRGFVWISWDPLASAMASSVGDDTVPLPKSRFPAAMKLPLSPRIGGLKKLRERMRTGSGGSTLATEGSTPADLDGASPVSANKGGLVRRASDKDAIAAAAMSASAEDDDGDEDDGSGEGSEGAVGEGSSEGRDRPQEDEDGSPWKAAADAQSDAQSQRAESEETEGTAADEGADRGDADTDSDAVSQAHGFKMVVQHRQQVRRTSKGEVLCSSHSSRSYCSCALGFER